MATNNDECSHLQSALHRSLLLESLLSEREHNTGAVEWFHGFVYHTRSILRVKRLEEQTLEDDVRCPVHEQAVVAVYMQQEH